MSDLAKVIYTALVGIGIYACSLNWELLIIWFILMIIDIITGNMKHSSIGNWSSKDMKKGLIKKVGEFLLLSALILSQRVINKSGISLPAGEIFAGIFAVKELGSIIENCIQMGVSVPDSITKWFKVAQDKIGAGNSEKEE